MIDMIIFWIVYGAVTVLFWVGIFIFLVGILNLLIIHITHGDYNIDKWEEYLEDIFLRNEPPIVVVILGFVANLVVSLWYVIGALSDNRHKVLSHHEVALKMSEQVVEHLSTPLIIGILITGFVVGARKVYPKFKKVKQALSKIEQQVDNKQD
ncbi:MAG: hypothetical protein EX285_03510 [Thaumarchaeota archaeon]|nr:hypothetical protein [Nitrososphaerota archaeon]